MPQETEVNTRSADLQGHSILLVDDEPSMRLALNETLGRAGYRTQDASGAKEALRLLARESFDILLTDVRMPNMSGIDLLRQVRQRWPGTSVVVMTAYGTISDAVEAMKLGARDYVLKPFSSEKIEETLARVAGPAVGSHSPAGEFLTRDPATLAVLRMAEEAARSKATILIHGESGTGKELLARFIHRASPRSDGPFVAVNCAALPENLLESELFGFEKGAFTGADASKPGKFELAEAGTLLLDEISEMPMLLQAKLLRVLQEDELDRIGGKQPMPIDVRVIAVTNRDLPSLVHEGGFRDDLYYRLNVFPLEIPPLRCRREDIELLVNHFVQRHARELGRDEGNISSNAVKVLKRRSWPGNVRELQNILLRAQILSTDGCIRTEHLKCATERAVQGPPIQAGLSVREMERKLIEATLEQTDGNRSRAAEILGISLRTLRNKLRDYREAATG